MSVLFENAMIGSLKVKNRFVRSATWEELAGKGGHLTPELMKLYESLAKGGVGTIVTSFAYVNKCDSQGLSGLIAIYDDSFIEEYRKLTEMVHSHGAKIILQIGYGGDDSTMNTMTKAELDEQIGLHAAAAIRAKKSGFDGIQFHCCHGSWQNRFLTPFYNQRTDEYGGSLENRSRILLELYQAAREATGPDFSIWIKINCEDFIDEGGFTLDECKIVCKKLSEAGMDLIEISGSNDISRKGEGSIRSGITSTDREAYFGRQAFAIAREVSIPVASVGGIRSLEVMEELIRQGVSFISMCRPFLREPDLINKLSREESKKAKCISCNKCYNVPGKVCVFN